MAHGENDYAWRLHDVLLCADHAELIHRIIRFGWRFQRRFGCGLMGSVLIRNVWSIRHLHGRPVGNLMATRVRYQFDSVSS